LVAWFSGGLFNDSISTIEVIELRMSCFFGQFTTQSYVASSDNGVAINEKLWKGSDRGLSGDILER